MLRPTGYLKATVVNKRHSSSPAKGSDWPLMAIFQQPTFSLIRFEGKVDNLIVERQQMRRPWFWFWVLVVVLAAWFWPGLGGPRLIKIIPLQDYPSASSPAK
jgi:hypothetical protein